MKKITLLGKSKYPFKRQQKKYKARKFSGKFWLAGSGRRADELRRPNPAGLQLNIAFSSMQRKPREN